MSLTGLVFASPAHLGLETGFDSIDGTPGATRLTRHKEDTVLLDKECVW